MKFFVSINTAVLMSAVDGAKGVSDGFKGRTLHLLSSRGVFKIKEINPFELGSLMGEILGSCSPGEVASYTAMFKQLMALCEDCSKKQK